MPEQQLTLEPAVVTNTELDIHTGRPSSAVMNATGTGLNLVPSSPGTKPPHPSSTAYLIMGRLSTEMENSVSGDDDAFGTA